MAEVGDAWADYNCQGRKTTGWHPRPQPAFLPNSLKKLLQKFPHFFALLLDRVFNP
jgi:hypothetical protein